MATTAMDNLSTNGGKYLNRPGITTEQAPAEYLTEQCRRGKTPAYLLILNANDNIGFARTLNILTNVRTATKLIAQVITQTKQRSQYDG